MIETLLITPPTNFSPSVFYFRTKIILLQRKLIVSFSINSLAIGNTVKKEFQSVCSIIRFKFLGLGYNAQFDFSFSKDYFVNEKITINNRSASANPFFIGK